MEEIKKECCDCGPDCNCGTKYKKCGKIIIVTLFILVFGAIAIVSILRDRIVNQNTFQISVVGQGKVSSAPDTANVTLGVQIDKVAKAEDALNQLNAKMNKITEAIVKLGIDKANITTQNYSLYPNYDYVASVSRVSGYNANQTLIVKVGDIEKNQDMVSRVVSEATKSGANQVSGISFENSKLDQLKQEARLKAIASAKEKSKDVESALGLKLGKIVGMWENFVSSPDVYSSYYADGKGGVGAGAVSSPTVPAGTQDVVVEVNLSYKIK